MARLNYPDIGGGGGATPEEISQTAHPIGDYQIWHSLDLPQEIGIWPETEWALLNGTLLPRADYPELEALVQSGGTRLAVINSDDIELLDYTGRVPQAVGRAGAGGADLEPGRLLGDRQRVITGTGGLLLFASATGASGALSGSVFSGNPFYGTQGTNALRLTLNSANAPDNPTGPTNDPQAITAYMIMRVK